MSLDLAVKSNGYGSTHMHYSPFCDSLWLYQVLGMARPSSQVLYPVLLMTSYQVRNDKKLLWLCVEQNWHSTTSKKWGAKGNTAAYLILIQWRSLKSFVTCCWLTLLVFLHVATNRQNLHWHNNQCSKNCLDEVPILCWLCLLDNNQSF